MKTDKSKHIKKHRIPLLTLFFALFVFIIFTATMAIMGLVSYLLIQNGLWANTGRTASVLYSLLVFALASIGVGTFLAVFIGRRSFRPVIRLVNGMKRLAHGDYQVRLPEGRHRLGREVSGSFNMLAEELQNTEILRSDFVNNFSHEFKTPIVSIQGFAQLLNRGGLPEARTKEYLEIIEEESRRLADMATSVLNFSKIENQKILTGTSRYNLSEQIRTCVLLLEKKWSRKQLELSLEFQEHMITANEELLKQIWINLLDNAIKFTPEKGSVAVSIQENPETICVQVKNTGSEIRPEEQKRIFQKFYQSDSSHARDGTGLGLAIARRVAELHGGEISVESHRQQTVFTVELPRREDGD